MKDSKTLAFPCIFLGCLGLATMGCEAPDPNVTNTTGSGGSGGSAEVHCDVNVGTMDMSGPMCKALPDDYTPRDNASMGDTWQPCISDGNKYVPFDMNISSMARVAALEKISELLGFGGLKTPTPQDFIDARVQYTLTEGIESRVVRREDDHYPAAPKLCRDMTPAEQAQYPDRCVGPVKIVPILNAAFEAGIKGEEPVLNSARIEAALLWFFYISTYKEAISAAETFVDTDSCWAYYTGGEPRENAIGFAKYVHERSQEAHDRIWDALLAVRCWRDLDNPTGVAMDKPLQMRAVGQLDRALLRGVALIVRQRALAASSCELVQPSVEILGQVLLREAEVRDPVQAAVLAQEVSKAPPNVADGAKVAAAIDALFPCP